MLTIEVVGEFLGLATDQGLHRHFRRHRGALFPALGRVHRTTFARQAANRWAVKHALWQQHVRALVPRPQLHVLDSAPVPVCRFARATFCRRLREVAAYGDDAVARQTFYGVRAPLRVAWPGVVTGVELAPGNVSDLAMAPEVLAGAQGWALGDRNYWSPAVRETLHADALALLAPFRSKTRERSYRRRVWKHVKSGDTFSGEPSPRAECPTTRKEPPPDAREHACVASVKPGGPPGQGNRIWKC